MAAATRLVWKPIWRCKAMFGIASPHWRTSRSRAEVTGCCGAPALISPSMVLVPAAGYCDAAAFLDMSPQRAALRICELCIEGLIHVTRPLSTVPGRKGAPILHVLALRRRCAEQGVRRAARCTRYAALSARHSARVGAAAAGKESRSAAIKTLLFSASVAHYELQGTLALQYSRVIHLSDAPCLQEKGRWRYVIGPYGDVQQ